MAQSQTEQRPVARLLAALAEAEGVDPAAMDPPLADVIDPEALAALLDHTPETDDVPLEVRFTYRGHDVVVRRNGDIEVQ
ncbi:MAG: HalOD1 output domain-containing protein [Haloarculaceae archaeon]|jgi:hypothetical protein